LFVEFHIINVLDCLLLIAGVVVITDNEDYKTESDGGYYSWRCVEPVVCCMMLLSWALVNFGL